ncbi:nectin-1-like isoform X1 [Carcharodon carcharias]|uniref:nectin-1-like isoform X1 n=2 Tax=Carcharodon carcharias TaxID=13397 RepID=UPI001B7F4C27|nr:nectin-1-like isoform X1 [Carcharodon carcharias]
MVTLLLIVFLNLWAVSDAQNVKVERNVFGYVGHQAVLRCQIVDLDNSLQVTQITWMKDPASAKINLAVYNPDLGTNYPTDTGGRIHFRQPSDRDATLVIERLEMADEGMYSCEFATYPDGNQEAATNLTILAKPTNDGTAIVVKAGPAEVPVAVCNSANGKPAASISWSGNVEGNASYVTTKNSDGTFTVKSEYKAVPSGEIDGVQITCSVNQQTLKQPAAIPITLSVQYVPIVIIEGYDDNWYLGRDHASLTCSAKANPSAKSYTWLMNGEAVPSSAHVVGHQLTVNKVTYAVNGTFTCQVTNSLGEGRAKMDVLVREQEVAQSSNARAIAGGVIGGILALLLIIFLVGFFLHKQQSGAAGSYDPKRRVFGTGNGAPQPDYTYRPDSDSEKGPSVTVTPSTTVEGHHSGEAENLLTSEPHDYENYKSREGDEEEGESGIPRGPVVPLPGLHRDEVQMEDDMESQRDGSIISKRAVYV